MRLITDQLAIDDHLTHLGGVFKGVRRPPKEHQIGIFADGQWSRPAVQYRGFWQHQW